MGRKKPDRDIVNVDKLKIENKVEIDYDKLAQALVKANLELREKENARLQAEEIEAIQKGSEVLGEKDFSYIKNKAWRSIRIFFNRARVFLKLLTLSKKEAECFVAVSELTKMLTSALLFSISLVFYILAAITVYISLEYGIPIVVGGISFALLFIAIARIIRIARFEVERMKDDGHLMNTSMTVIAVVTLLFTVIGIVISSVT